MSNKGLYTSGSTAISAKVDSIPLRDTDATQPGKGSIGDLVSNASQQISQLVRGEIELAKKEILGEVMKGAVGGGLLAGAGVIALYSSFFFFLFIAAVIAIWLPWWAAFGIVFLLMIVLAGLLGLGGFISLKKVKAPERTVESVTELKNLVPGKAQENLAEDNSALYTGAPAPTGCERATGGSTAVTKK